MSYLERKLKATKRINFNTEQQTNSDVHTNIVLQRVLNKM